MGLLFINDHGGSEFWAWLIPKSESLGFKTCFHSYHRPRHLRCSGISFPLQIWRSGSRVARNMSSLTFCSPLNRHASPGTRVLTYSMILSPSKWQQTWYIQSPVMPPPVVWQQQEELKIYEVLWSFPARMQSWEVKCQWRDKAKSGRRWERTGDANCQVA